MVYMQMLFALTFDKLVWGTTPGFLSIVGSSLILGSAIYVALHKQHPQNIGVGPERGDISAEEQSFLSPNSYSPSRDDELDIPMARLR